jgi:hypothetical protein
MSLLRCLVKAGADVNVSDNDGTTPLHYAPIGDCAVLLLSVGAKVCALTRLVTPLHRVIGDGNHFDVCALLAAGADLDVADDTGETGLASCWLVEMGQSIPTKSMSRAETLTLQRHESTLCVILRLRSVSVCNRSNWMRCKCAIFCNSRAARLRL